jgi:hypothetical protein
VAAKYQPSTSMKTRKNLNKRGTKWAYALVLACLIFCQKTAAHGGVGMDEDGCIINIGFLKAHFTIYQPKISKTDEFCEDIPEVADSMFVIEYLHDFLKEMLVDFRIIKDINNFGTFANWEDITTLENIDQATIYYQPAVKRPGNSFVVNHEFQQEGGYIGIVTAVYPEKDLFYHAVFYFQVGGNDYGVVPFFIALVLLAQLLYWYSTRATKKTSIKKL